MPLSDNFEDCISALAPTGGVVAGTMYRIGNTLGMAMTSADAGAYFSFKIRGRIKNAPKYALSGQGMAAGAIGYWDVTNKRFTVTATGMKDHKVTIAEPATALAAVCDVILTGSPAA